MVLNYFALMALIQVVATQPHFTREELVAVRNSLRFVAVELHNICGILDTVIERNGGPAPPSPAQRAVESIKFPNHIDHSTIEKALKFASTQDVRDSRKLSEMFDIRKEPPSKVSLGLFEVSTEALASVVSAVAYVGLILIVLCYDIFVGVVGQVVFLPILRDSSVPQPPSPLPGRSRSPVRETVAPPIPRDRSIIQAAGAPEVIMRGALMAIGLRVPPLILGDDFLGHYYLILLNIVRVLSFLVLVLIVWDGSLLKSSSAPQFGNS